MSAAKLKLTSDKNILFILFMIKPKYLSTYMDKKYLPNAVEDVFSSSGLLEYD